MRHNVPDDGSNHHSYRIEILESHIQNIPGGKVNILGGQLFGGFISDLELGWLKSMKFFIFNQINLILPQIL
jgi:hypothetical protein